MNSVILIIVLVTIAIISQIRLSFYKKKLIKSSREGNRHCIDGVFYYIVDENTYMNLISKESMDRFNFNAVKKKMEKFWTDRHGHNRII